MQLVRRVWTDQEPLRISSSWPSSQRVRIFGRAEAGRRKAVVRTPRCCLYFVVLSERVEITHSPHRTRTSNRRLSMEGSLPAVVSIVGQRADRSAGSEAMMTYDPMIKAALLVGGGGSSGIQPSAEWLRSRSEHDFTKG